MCRLEFFGLYRRALLSSGGRLRRESRERRHIDLDRALGIGVAFTNLQLYYENVRPCFRLAQFTSGPKLP